MKVLVAGFDTPTTQRLTEALSSQGFTAIGAGGREVARSLAEQVAPDRILIPIGDRGDDVEYWLADAETGPTLRIDPSEDPNRALAAFVPQEEEDEAPPETEPDLPAGPPPAAVQQPKVQARASEDTGPTRSSGAPSLGAKLAQVRFGDYHSVLEVESGTPEHVVRQQFEQLSHLYSPAGWPAKLSEEDVEMIVEVGRGLRDALTMLSDAKLRARYESALARTGSTSSGNRR